MGSYIGFAGARGESSDRLSDDIPLIDIGPCVSINDSADWAEPYEQINGPGREDGLVLPRLLGSRGFRP